MSNTIKHLSAIIVLAFISTGCVSSQALYFHERTKLGISAQVKPEDPQEKVAAHVGFKRRIVAIVPPKKLACNTAKNFAKDSATSTSKCNNTDTGDSNNPDNYHEGEALSLVSTFQVEANILKSVHIHNNFASGQAAKNLVAADAESLQYQANLDKFLEFLQQQKTNTATVGAETPEPAHASLPHSGLQRSYYDGPPFHLASNPGIGLATSGDPETAANTEKAACLKKLEEEGRQCALTWLGKLAGNTKINFIEDLALVKNAQENKQDCLGKLTSVSNFCQSTLLAKLAENKESDVRGEIEVLITKKNELKKKAVETLLKRLDQVDDLAFPFNVLKDIFTSLIGMFADATESFTKKEIADCAKDLNACENKNLKELLSALKDNPQLAACAQDLEACGNPELKESLKNLEGLRENG